MRNILEKLRLGHDKHSAFRFHCSVNVNKKQKMSTIIIQLQTNNQFNSISILLSTQLK